MLEPAKYDGRAKNAYKGSAKYSNNDSKLTAQCLFDIYDVVRKSVKFLIFT